VGKKTFDIEKWVSNQMKQKNPKDKSIKKKLLNVEGAIAYIKAKNKGSTLG
jgi:hypothetical protein